MNATKIVVAALATIVTFVALWLLPAAGGFRLSPFVALLVGLGLVLALRKSSIGEPRALPEVPGDFFVHRMGREEGPLPFSALVSDARRGSLTGETRVRTPESTWFAAREMVPAIFSRRTWLAALLLSVFVGGLGVDRFYLGRVATGVLKLLTLGGLGLWSLIDIILIATNRMTDRDGRPLAR